MSSYNGTCWLDFASMSSGEQYEENEETEMAQAKEDPKDRVRSEPVEEDDNWTDLIHPFIAELIGSAIFIFVACGAGMNTLQYTVIGAKVTGIALAFGFTIFVLCFSIGHISGAHLNFAVTFTLCLLRRISIKRCAAYFLAQFLGGMIGVGFLKLITPKSLWASCFAANNVTAGLNVGCAFLAEMILTFFLVFVVMAACDTNKSNQTLVPFAIGMAVFCCHMIGLQLDGCSINPTRSFASSVAASGIVGCEYAWANHWVYWYCFHEGGGKVDRLIDQYILKKKQGNNL